MSFDNLITELDEQEKKNICDTILLDSECAELIAVYIPIDEGKEYSIKEYVFEVKDNQKFSEYLSRFSLIEEVTKPGDVSFGDIVLSCRNVYASEEGYDMALYEYGQNYWIVKQGYYISDTYRKTAENISFKYAFKKLYG